jgi:hypothetical protein
MVRGQSMSVTALFEAVQQLFDIMNRMLDSALPTIYGTIQLLLDSKIEISMFWLLLVGVSGIGVGWRLAKLFDQKRITELSTTLAIEQERKSDLAQTVEALSNKALRQNKEAFFALANGRLPLADWQRAS